MFATTGTRPSAASTHVPTTFSRSSASMQANSPVVPQAQMPWAPSMISQRVSRYSERRSTWPSASNGVRMGGMMPWYCSGAYVVTLSTSKRVTGPQKNADGNQMKADAYPSIRVHLVSFVFICVRSFLRLRIVNACRRERTLGGQAAHRQHARRREEGEVPLHRIARTLSGHRKQPRGQRLVQAHGQGSHVQDDRAQLTRRRVAGQRHGIEAQAADGGVEQ